MADPKIPPHSLEAEQSVLGAILIDKNAIVEVAGFLRPEHFYEDRHGQIFSAMLALYEERRPIDLLTLTEKLKGLKTYKDVGGSTYLTELTAVVPTSAHVEEYGKIIRELCAKRQLIAASAAVTELSFDSGKNLQDVLDQAESKIFSISQENLERNFVSMKDILTRSFDRLDEIQKRGAGLRGVPTGWKDLDDVLAGFQESNLVILAARPGIGKTAFLLNIAQHVAVKEKMPVGVFSLEMSQEELGDRLLVMQAGIDAWKLKTGKLDDEDLDKLQDAMGVLAEAPVFIDDTPGITLMEMRTKARRLQMEHGLKLLLVDYLQLVNPGRSLESRVQEVSIVSQALKNLARELRIPVISASQLNRQVEARGSKKPQLADLRESGSIEQDADVVMFLYRGEETKDLAPGDKIPTTLSIDKHRNGALREINYMFNGAMMQFKLLAKT
ncbi:replicative DNA helicase [Patescibacteria group bacterium]|nr:replicative DNA helicase [Patescibacteria group bacterium]